MCARQIFSIVVLIFLLLIIGCGSSNIKKAESYIDAGMYKEAIDLLKIEIQDNPKNPEGHYLLGLATLSLGSDSEANEYFNRAILIESKYREKVGEAYLKVGQKYLLEGNSNGAIARFRQAKERNPEIASKIGELYFAQGDKLSKVNEKSTEAISMFENAFSFDSRLGEKIASMCYEIALSLKKQGDWERAIQYGLCSIKTDPSHIMDFENLSYELLVSLVASDQIEEFEKALVLIDKSSFSFKDKSHIENLGKFLYDKAIELAKRKDNKYLIAFRFGEKFLPDYYKTKENDQEFVHYFTQYKQKANITLFVSARYPFPVGFTTPKGYLSLSANDQDKHRPQGAWSDNSGEYVVSIFYQPDGTIRLEAKGIIVWMDYRGVHKECDADGTPRNEWPLNDPSFDFTPSYLICPEANIGALVGELNGRRFLIGKSKIISLSEY
jgi:tetratricopeptide (TPR) repeat protein